MSWATLEFDVNYTIITRDQCNFCDTAKALLSGNGLRYKAYNEHTYQQAPYQEVGKSDYEMLLSCMPDSIDWSKLSEYEVEDNTAGSQTLACSGDSCEIVDLT